MERVQEEEEEKKVLNYEKFHEPVNQEVRKLWLNTSRCTTGAGKMFAAQSRSMFVLENKIHKQHVYRRGKRRVQAFMFVFGWFLYIFEMCNPPVQHHN